MKTFTVVAAIFSVSILVVLAILQIFGASLPNGEGHSLAPQINSSENPAIPVTGVEKKVAPVFDVSGRMVSNPSGLVLNSVYSNDRTIAPVFDTTGAVISDPSGIILNAANR